MMMRMSSVIVRAMLIVALVFGVTPLAEAQSPAAKEKPAAAKVKSPASAKSARGMADGTQEGIKVHGHWTIEVRNPDGSLSSHTEFENALAPSGQTVLAMLLGRLYVVGSWRIRLGDGTGAGPCAAGVQSSECVISENGPAYPWQFPNLTRTTPSNIQLVLSGTATAAHPFIMSSVSTEQWMCNDPTISPNNCFLSSAFPASSSFILAPFTGRTLQNPVSVVAGQIIQVTVVISFS